MLNTAEDLILLALNDSTGAFYRMTEINFNLALVGALFMDLAALKRIDISQDTLLLLSKESTGDEFLDQCLSLIAEASPEKGCSELIRVVYSGFPQLKERLLNSLVQRKILRLQEDKILWVFHARRYPIVDDREEQEVLTRIRSVIIEAQEPQARDTVLIALLCVCDLIDKVFSKEELNAHCKRIELVRNMDLISPAVYQIIAEIQVLMASTFSA
ncbi:MAG TPA: GPP34 family phosphoprotein [Candidatus Cloacimonadota bacterium]|nr:GPP34 family phosphoprotein [Candidatus Cloacimonadota bacterium]